MKSCYLCVVLLTSYLQNHSCREKSCIYKYSPLSCSSWHKYSLKSPANCICGSDFSQHWALGKYITTFIWNFPRLVLFCYRSFPHRLASRRWPVISMLLQCTLHRVGPYRISCVCFTKQNLLFCFCLLIAASWSVVILEVEVTSEKPQVIALCLFSPVTKVLCFNGKSQDYFSGVCFSALATLHLCCMHCWLTGRFQ